MILTDLHTHTDLSGDCKTPAKDMIDKARSLGLKYYGITDHHDVDFPECGLNFQLDLDHYDHYIHTLQDTYTTHDFTLLYGIEYGMQPHLGPDLNHIQNKYTYDYIIGSNHLANGVDPYDKTYFDGISRNEGYLKYFKSIADNLELFNHIHIMAHLDYVIRYWRRDDHRLYAYDEFKDVLDTILKTLIRKDIALEVNTSGYKYRLGQAHPSYDVLSRYYDLGGRLITLGSDAHLPENIGDSFGAAEAKLKAIGFQAYVYYKKRRPFELPL